MHDIDRTLDESNYNDYDDQEFFENEFEYEDELEDEFEDEFEYEYEYEDELEFEAEEESELELAAELLSLNSESELEYFFGKLFRKAKRFVKSKRGRALTGMLRRRFKKVLPMAGTAVGAYFGGPAGAKIGGRASSILGNYFEYELEGMSPEDQELEASKALIKVARDAASMARRIPSSVQAQRAARMAIVKAAKKHAPGLLKNQAGAAGTSASCACGKRTGKKGAWHLIIDRSGNKKLLINV